MLIKIGDKISRTCQQHRTIRENLAESWLAHRNLQPNPVFFIFEPLSLVSSFGIYPFSNPYKLISALPWYRQLLEPIQSSPSAATFISVALK